MKTSQLKLAYSTCPNDTFMFDALVNRRIDSEGLEFDVRLADIEELNREVLGNEPDISKISYAAYPLVSDRYQLLRSGSALGYGNGPLIVSRKKIYPDEIEHACVAIPGKMTTANFLLSILFPGVRDKKTFLFSDIADAVLDNEADVGVLIHETRFTWQEKGLKLVADLGVLWEEKFNLPIPLGGIVIKRDLPFSVKMLVERKISESILFGFEFPDLSRAYIRQFAQELSEDVLEKHIHTYVNEFSASLGNKGEEAVRTLFLKGLEARLFESITEPVFPEK